MAECLKRIDDTTVEVPVGCRPGMRVKGVIFVDRAL